MFVLNITIYMTHAKRNIHHSVDLATHPYSLHSCLALVASNKLVEDSRDEGLSRYPSFYQATVSPKVPDEGVDHEG